MLSKTITIKLKYKFEQGYNFDFGNGNFSSSTYMMKQIRFIDNEYPIVYKTITTIFCTYEKSSYGYDFDLLNEILDDFDLMMEYKNDIFNTKYRFGKDGAEHIYYDFQQMDVECKNYVPFITFALELSNNNFIRVYCEHTNICDEHAKVLAVISTNDFMTMLKEWRDYLVSTSW